MTPAARTQAAIELLDQIIVAARDGGASADVLIQRGFAARRYAGSKDRRAIRGLIYDAIRFCGERPGSGRAALLALAATDVELAATFDGSSYGPAPRAAGEPVAQAGIAPGWLIEGLAASGIGTDQAAAMLGRAPLDLRVNTLKASVAQVRAALPDALPVDGLAAALRLPSDTPVEKTQPYADGWIEVQDAGSQTVTLAAGAQPGMRVVDLCAGGGGKTLALAAAMGNRGELLASDSDRSRLSRLLPRAERAGVSIVGTRLLNPGREIEPLADWTGTADVVLIDAPCSGTGTWRRNPEARWRLTPARLAKLVETQARLLDVGAALVKPGGTLIHIVCSLLDAEGTDQVEALLARQPGWSAAPLALPLGTPHGPGMRLTPLSHSTDGFFVAKLVRT
ncbi:RsmB/NOP family class I SAM-dependent RNA methyltransferase [Sphingomonas koreensis]|uniref:RsmB/NOP family class I SAM-dependent RNA methyltransferase n=1 Tax=Sphingomonas koreensis TaxID=93064 RepID=UPI0008357AE3|nr:RsmB/NOP family class I SAM-dependent RNA methyltransferase [Sphingomonas koreensis]PJI87638.1 16S rRNA (cytosine967-C5)-methyltransferase [Sphingomonas koreensis]RSU63005.1 RsmB/NOP family class I SAM-dependent RNA methyltransferase [Sphingomonas koreensis]RSU71713.1 RsmB/NOP family class I SAM-dependent RNA methyltransferase [Sphingomonas koreensis]